MAAILSGAMMLEHWGMMEESSKIKSAVNQALAENMVTVDLNPESSQKTSDVGTYLAEFILHH